MPASSKGRVAALIAEQAEAHEASVLHRSGDMLLVLVRLRRPSGKVVPYHLRIEAGDDEPGVREEAPEHLPTYCPNRHVNVDGYFCLSFPEEDPLAVRDAESAAAWWRRLLKYLNLQETTSTLRRWPSTHEWAHGSAAVFQGRAERCAQALGHRFVEALGRRRLKAVRRKAQPEFVQLRNDGKRIYSVWAKGKRVATLRQTCFCGSGLPIASCADHAARAAELPFALEAWEREERRFWEFARGRKCCGTLKDCPLNVTAPATPTTTVTAAQAA
jgi:hypothetical protein